jgi:hypothetical protein
MLYMKIIAALTENYMKPRLWLRYAASECCIRWYTWLTFCFKMPLCSFLQIKKRRAVFILYSFVYLQKYEGFEQNFVS